MWTIGFLILVCLLLGGGAWLFFIWTVKSGQYDDIEGAKYRMLEDDDDEPHIHAKAKPEEVKK